MHQESSSALYLGAWQGNSNPKTDEMAVLSCLSGTAWVSPLTPMGSDWYLSADNCNLGGEGESERASQKCKWLREGAAYTWGQRPRPIPVAFAQTGGRRGRWPQEHCMKKPWVHGSQFRWECGKEESCLLSDLTLYNVCWDIFCLRWTIGAKDLS